METEFLQVFHVNIAKNWKIQAEFIFFEKISIFIDFYVDKMQKFSFQSIPGALKQYIHRNWAVLREKIGSKLSFSKPGLKNSIPEKHPKWNFK